MPLCKRVAEAGWEPITAARSSDAQVYVERFGQRYLTVFNDSPQPRSVTITRDARSRRPAGSWFPAIRFPGATENAELALGGEDVAVLELP